MISLIMPYRNAERWIGRAIKSLLVQTEPMEFILVNDHSTDNGPQLVQSLTDRTGKEFILVDNMHEPGVGGARNTGLDFARGEWVTFLDADDELTADASKIFGFMTELDPTANIVQANHFAFRNGRRIPLKSPTDKGVYNFRNMPGYSAYVTNKIFRRSFLEENELRFLEGGFSYGEDEVFVLDCMAKDDRIFHTKRTTCTMVVHRENTESASQTLNEEKLLRQTRELLNFIERTDNKDAKAYVRSLIALHWNHRKYKSVFG